MASNKDLIEQAQGLAGELKKEVTTEGLTNAQLAKLVKALKAEVAANADTGEEAKKAGGKKTVILQSRFGDKVAGEKISLPAAQAEQMVADSWASFPKKEK